MHEVEALVLDALEQDRILRRFHGVPSHVRHHGRVQAVHGPGPLGQTLRTLTVLDTFIEHDLKTHANSQNGPAAAQATIDETGSLNGSESVHHSCEGTHTRDDQAVGVHDVLRVGAELHACSRGFQGPHRGVDIAGAVIENDDARGGHLFVTGVHKAPLVDGMESAMRASGSTASRSARASALNCASTMWCGSRPRITSMCRHNWA